MSAMEASGGSASAVRKIQKVRKKIAQLIGHEETTASGTVEHLVPGDEADTQTAAADEDCTNCDDDRDFAGRGTLSSADDWLHILPAGRGSK